MSNKSPSFRSSRIVYYGPHPCENCGVLIVKMGQEFGGNAFTNPTVMIYPNPEWHVHFCDPVDVHVRKGKEAREYIRAIFTRPIATRLSLGWIIVAKGPDKNVPALSNSAVISAHQTFATTEWGAWQSAHERYIAGWPTWGFPDKYPVLEEKE